MNSNKVGITLIALVVTVIVLLILAGVSVTLILGPNGMIERTKQSKVATRYSQITELENVRSVSNLVNVRVGDSIETEDQFITRLEANNLFIDGVFNNSKNITGNIPETLLVNAISVEYVGYLFLNALD